MNCLRKDFEDVVKPPFNPSTYTHLLVVEVKQTFTEEESQGSELSVSLFHNDVSETAVIAFRSHIARSIWTPLVMSV